MTPSKCKTKQVKQNYRLTKKSRGFLLHIPSEERGIRDEHIASAVHDVRDEHLKYGWNLDIFGDLGYTEHPNCPFDSLNYASLENK